MVNVAACKLVPTGVPGRNALATPSTLGSRGFHGYKNELILNAREFGAVGDGVTDDAAAIQALINAAIAAGVPAYIPGGEYSIGTTLSFGRVDGQLIFGDGPKSTRLVYTGPIPGKAVTQGNVEVAFSFTGQPTVGNKVTLNGTDSFFRASGATGEDVNLGADRQTTIQNAIAKWNVSTDPQISKCYYVGLPRNEPANFNTICCTPRTNGMDAFVISDNDSAIDSGVPTTSLIYANGWQNCALQDLSLTIADPGSGAFSHSTACIDGRSDLNQVTMANWFNSWGNAFTRVNFHDAAFGVLIGPDMLGAMFSESQFYGCSFDNHNRNAIRTCSGNALSTACVSCTVSNCYVGFEEGQGGWVLILGCTFINNTFRDMLLSYGQGCAVIGCTSTTNAALNSDAYEGYPEKGPCLLYTAGLAFYLSDCSFHAENLTTGSGPFDSTLAVAAHGNICVDNCYSNAGMYVQGAYAALRGSTFNNYWAEVGTGRDPLYKENI